MESRGTRNNKAGLRLFGSAYVACSADPSYTLAVCGERAEKEIAENESRVAGLAGGITLYAAQSSFLLMYMSTCIVRLQSEG